ncbi:MAG: protein kinase [Gemmatimonadales bacterium]|nr:protein kinase [Gemmatimonadales bacterium]
MPPRTMPTGAVEVSKVRTALADRYKILRVLGEGGMATVYLAEDLKHKREVAVKVMRPELAETLGAERFLREVEIAAKLSHPHILPVYDSGASQGVLYYVMPVVEGESLPSRLRREKQLPVEEALRLAREVAEAMAYAHARGFVHRDIKPANILLSAGHALVADFGIARAIEQGDGNAITQTGLAIGTPQYMSPEQASGASDLDGRSDIYALGCVLYEMLAGEPPFTGPTAQAVIVRSMTETPRPIEQTRTTIAPSVSVVLNRALAKSPADRYADAGAMVKALVAAERDTNSGVVTIPTVARRGVRPWQIGLAAAAVLAVGAVGFKMFGGNAGTAATATAAKRVAVLPFQHVGREEDAYLADGIVEELRGKLAKLPNLTIIASTSANQYRGSKKTGPEIAKELRVDQVLTGKVQWAGGGEGARKVRVSAELVDGQSGAITWRETFDADLTDVFAMQSQLATRVAGALGAVLGQAATADLATRPTSNAQAYELYLKGQAIKNPGAGSMRQAAGYFAQAVALDSTFVEAWARLGATLSLVYANGNRDPDVRRQAKDAIDRALALAPGRAVAIRASATYANALGDSEGRDRAIARALAIEPDNAEILASAGGSDFARGDYAEALAKFTRARERDPRSALILQRLVDALTNLGRAREAVALGDELIAIAPTDLQALHSITLAHLAAGDLDGAKRMAREALTRIPPTELVASFAGINELAFLFDRAERDLLFRLTPAAFDNDRAWWGQALAIAAHQQGDLVRAKAYADSSLAESKRQSDANPNDPQLRALYAVMLAYAGKSDEALRQADRAVADAPATSTDLNTPYTRMQRTRVLLVAGRTNEALDQVEEVMGLQYHLSPGYLRVDPMFTPLKGNPRFEQLQKGSIAVPKN